MADRLECLSYALRNEVGGSKNGGLTDDPADPGGLTKFGICQRDHPTVDIRALTLAGAIAILTDEYWSCAGLNDNCVAAKFIDLAVNLEGTGKQGAAVKILQGAIDMQFPDSLREDGVYGPFTESQANRCNPASLLMAMDSLACSWYRADVACHPNLAKYLDGWLARARRIPVYDPTAVPGDRITAGIEAA